jgi:hypothetical protein
VIMPGHDNSWNQVKLSRIGWLISLVQHALCSLVIYVHELLKSLDSHIFVRTTWRISRTSTPIHDSMYQYPPIQSTIFYSESAIFIGIHRCIILATYLRLHTVTCDVLHSNNYDIHESDVCWADYKFGYIRDMSVTHELVGSHQVMVGHSTRS